MTTAAQFSWSLFLGLLAAEVAVVVGVAALFQAWTSSARWQRTHWQVCTLALGLLVLCELSGLGRGLAGWLRGARPAVRATGKSQGETVESSNRPFPLTPALSLGERENLRPPQVNSGAPRSAVASLKTQPRTDAVRLASTRRTTLPAHEPMTGKVGRAVLSAPLRDRSGMPDGALGERRPTYLVQGREPPKLGPAEVAAAPDSLEVGPAKAGTPNLARWRTNLVADSPWNQKTTWAIGFIWLLGMGVVLARLCLGRLLLLLFRWRCPLVRDPALQENLLRLTHGLGLRRRVRLIESANLAAPMAFGLVRPLIGLPVGFARRFAAAQREAVLAHELAHLTAHDPAWHLLSDVVTAVWWWHPLAWWARRQLRATSETAADEASLLVANGPIALAECLVELGRRPLHPTPAAWMGITGGGFRSGLGRRVERLMNLGECTSRSPGRWRCGLAHIAGPAVLVFSVTLSTAWLSPQAQNHSMTTIPQSWKSSLAAFALMTAWGTDYQPAVAAPISPQVQGPAPAGEGPNLQRTPTAAAASPATLAPAQGDSKALGFDSHLGNVLMASGTPVSNQSPGATPDIEKPASRPTPIDETSPPANPAPGPIMSPEMMQRYGPSTNPAARTSPEMMRRYGLRPGQITGNPDENVLGRQAVQALLAKTVLPELKLPTGGLPLSEVVKYLDQETRQRDPQKHGLNFLLSSTPETSRIDPNTGLPMVAAESDLGNVTIKFGLPLRNLRLIDVLQAVTKLAEKPIKYSVTDYGVVFSFRPPGEPEQLQDQPAPRYRGMSAEMMRRYGFGRYTAQPPSEESADNLVSPQKEAIQTKLDRIVLDELKWPNGLSLSEAIKDLDREVRARDHEHVGINFILSEASAAPSAMAVDPTTGLPVSAQSADLGNIAVNFNLPLRNVRLKDVLEAMTQVAVRPIHYVVADYGVVFAAGKPIAATTNPSAVSAPAASLPVPTPTAPQKLQARTFQIEPKLFVQGLERTFGIKVEPLPREAAAGAPAANPADLRRKLDAARAELANLSERYTTKHPVVVQKQKEIAELQQAITEASAKAERAEAGGRYRIREAVLQLAEQLEVKFRHPGKEVFYNDATGLLMVRASAEDLATLQAAIETLGGSALGTGLRRDLLMSK